MITAEIPGWGSLEIKNLVLDFNGTIATDGRLIEGVAPLLAEIKEKNVGIYVITADTNGTVRKECEGLPVEVMTYDSGTVAVNKTRCPSHCLYWQWKKRQQNVWSKRSFDCSDRTGRHLYEGGNAGRYFDSGYPVSTFSPYKAKPLESDFERLGQVLTFLR